MQVNPKAERPSSLFMDFMKGIKEWEIHLVKTSTEKNPVYIELENYQFY